MARLFAALSLPAEVVRHLDEYADAVRGAHPELRWVRPDRWHITLGFLGECGPHEVRRQLERWARRARRSRPLTLRLHGAGTFPRAWMARVLWTGIAGDAEALTALVAYEQHAHVTLARTRRRADLTGVVDELSSYEGPSWTAADLVVIESHLRAAKDNGPQYETLERFPLGGDRTAAS